MREGASISVGVLPVFDDLNGPMSSNEAVIPPKVCAALAAEASIR
jgi:hypothetical protein